MRSQLGTSEVRALLLYVIIKCTTTLFATRNEARGGVGRVNGEGGKAESV